MSTDREPTLKREDIPFTRTDIDQLLQTIGRSEKLDVRGLNLKGIDLSYLNLAEALIARADLSGANLSGTDLTGADLSEANLSGAPGWGGVSHQFKPF